MVYSNRFVMCVLVNGVPQKELANGQVAIPFGSEYVLRFRNKHNRRAKVQIFIDGENVSGGGYIINANDSVDIRRHHDVDRAFRFVALDSPAAIEHGKNGPNPDKVKGTIEARFWLEREYTPPPVVEHHHHYYPRRRPYTPPPSPYPWVEPWKPTPYWSNDTKGMTGGDAVRGMSFGGTQSSLHTSGMSYNMGDAMPQASTHINEDLCPPAGQHHNALDMGSLESLRTLQEGCTVEGGSTGQSFYGVYFDAETDFVSLKVFLVGYVPGTPASAVPAGNAVEAPSDMKHCTNCGAKRAKKSAKFCHNCGAKL